ncbi:trypsin-like peptidase domain-containing protein [Bacillus sp. TH22]|uniref:trypsin-like serine peptidase n=1 Tax=unclassified Bacillus (in: firmicutes) TaxID=185979 RepID=UPI001912C32A|nr:MULTISPECIES: serine protease [unclassified Bacillus (in: firmicutes)]MBK5447506.1 trypsin-like peptidase domain-containing protein [Bacillus sp. TH22]MBK5453637.1 trypsin-like peptidase domain-containing protein [Bacillus sp. TH23]
MFYREGPKFEILKVQHLKLQREQMILRNNLRQIATLQRAVHLAGAVARILLAPLPNGDTVVGTGFLIDKDLLLTNNHVFPTKESTIGAKIQFNYQKDLANNFLPVDEYSCESDVLFITDPELDYTVVKLNNNPGAKWGFIGLPNETEISEGEDVFIIQHPGGAEKMVSLSENMVTAVSGYKIQYITDTLGGSSGSPVFNDSWEVVALHHAAISDGNGKVNNEGIAIGEIKKKIKSQLGNGPYFH